MPEFVLVGDGRVAIPDSVIAADPGGFVDAPHPDKKQAKAGVMVKRNVRPLVEKYLAASPERRAQIEADAEKAHAVFAENAAREAERVAEAADPDSTAIAKNEVAPGVPAPR